MLNERQKKQHLIDTIDDWLEAAKDCIGLIGLGSFFQGTDNPDSDIDLIVVRHTQTYEKQVLEIEGVLFDITLCGPKALVWFCQQSYHKAHWVESLLLGSILQDETGQIKAFFQRLETARARFSVNEFQVRQLKGALANSLRKLQQHSEYPLLQMVAYSEWVTSAYQLLCLSQQQLAKQHMPLICQHIKQDFPQLAQLLDNQFSGALPKSLKTSLVALNHQLQTDVFPDITDLGVYKHQTMPV